MTTTSIMNDLFSTNDRGMFINVMLDDIADAYGVGIDDAEAFIDALVKLGIIVEDPYGDLYDIEERAEAQIADLLAEEEEREYRREAMNVYCSQM